jgi:hypothetical protein
VLESCAQYIATQISQDQERGLRSHSGSGVFLSVSICPPPKEDRRQSPHFSSEKDVSRVEIKETKTI